MPLTEYHVNFEQLIGSLSVVGAEAEGIGRSFLPNSQSATYTTSTPLCIVDFIGTCKTHVERPETGHGRRSYWSNPRRDEGKTDDIIQRPYFQIISDHGHNVFVATFETSLQVLPSGAFFGGNCYRL